MSPGAEQTTVFLVVVVHCVAELGEDKLPLFAMHIKMGLNRQNK